MFKFGGKIYLQQEGGSIGLRLTGSVARVVTDKWCRLLRNKMEINNMEVKLMVKYMDDLNLFLGALEKGVHWIGGKKGHLAHSDAAESQQIQDKASLSEITMNAFKDHG